MRTRILGTGMAVPDRVVTNDDLARLIETDDEWIRSRTGIGERRWASP
ncbi:MAG: 3-oxoacyl-ACP synthase, partial [Gemmatimonadales bacterium]|nr:3-oxoacyl-ACP synthase [Gemmatimonadales bacterium]